MGRPEQRSNSASPSPEPAARRRALGSLSTHLLQSRRAATRAPQCPRGRVRVDGGVAPPRHGVRAGHRVQVRIVREPTQRPPSRISAARWQGSPSQPGLSSSTQVRWLAATSASRETSSPTRTHRPGRGHDSPQLWSHSRPAPRRSHAPCATRSWQSNLERCAVSRSSRTAPASTE